MGKIGQFDTDLDALFTRVNSHKNFGSFDINKWIFSQLSIEKNNEILDLGCGFGNQTLELLKLECKVTAIDANSDSLDYLKNFSKSSTLKTIHSEFDSLEKLPSQFFDNVISSYSFYYANNYDELLKNIYQSMKKGAKIFVCGPSRKNNMEMKNFLRKVGVEFGEGSAPFMEDELPKLFKKYFGNFENIEATNTIEFPSESDVWKYWSSHNMFNQEIENKFKKLISDFFESNKKFVTTKVIRGVLSKKD